MPRRCGLCGKDRTCERVKSGRILLMERPFAILHRGAGASRVQKSSMSVDTNCVTGVESEYILAEDAISNALGAAAQVCSAPRAELTMTALIS